MGWGNGLPEGTVHQMIKDGVGIGAILNTAEQLVSRGLIKGF